MLDALDGHGPLAVQLICIPLVTLLLAVLQALTLVVLQQPVLAAEMPTTEATVADDALRRVFTILIAAANLLWGHAAAQGQRHAERGVGRDGVVGERCGSRGQVLACIHKAQVCWLRQVGAQGEKRTQCGDGSAGWY